MVTLADEVKLDQGGRCGRGRRPAVVTGVVLLVTAIGLGILGWILPTLGGSLVIPTLIVFGIGCAIGVIFWIVSGSWVSTACVAAITIVASVWTFAFSLPATLVLDSGATSQAQAVLVQVASSPRGQTGIPLHPCVTKMTGSIGPLDAPYRQCAVSTPEGHFVLFTPVGRNSSGLGFTDIGAATFLDECSRHLTGVWWMFRTDSNGQNACPIGYEFHGGP